MVEETRGASAGALSRALEVLERALEAPVVPGETEQRSENVRGAVARARDAFVARARRDHPQAREQIADVDPALLHRVESLERDCAALVESWSRAAAEANALTERADADPRDESSFRDRFARYAPETLALVLRTRAHEAALRTWTAEAFQRDRGGGD